jgi:hypothetical protein
LLSEVLRQLAAELRETPPEELAAKAPLWAAQLDVLARMAPAPTPSRPRPDPEALAADRAMEMTAGAVAELTGGPADGTLAPLDPGMPLGARTAVAGAVYALERRPGDQRPRLYHDEAATARLRTGR